MAEEPTEIEPQNSELMPEDGGADGTVDLNDNELLNDIVLSLERLDLGFDPKVLNILDDETATPQKIDELRDHLGETVSARLFSIANSVHYGKARSGHITRIRDVVTHLGTDATRAMVMFIALRALGDTEEMNLVFARGFATSKLSEILASQMSLDRQQKNMTSLGGLFIEIGQVIMMLYEVAEEKKLDDKFIENYYPYMNMKVIETFGLPLSLSDIVYHDNFTFVKKDSLAPSAIVDLAYAIIEKSFKKYGKLRVESPMPDLEGFLYASTIGSIFESQFQTMELSPYLEVIRAELTEQEQRLLDAQSRDT